MLATLFALTVAQAATGPHPVGWQDLSFDHTDQGVVYGRVYYPATTDGGGSAADTDQGPYPLVAQLHGWLGSAWMYDEFCLELASWGFVVAATDTETGVNLDMEVFAWDTVALIEYVEDQSARADRPLVDGGALSAVGHSMGGATLGRLIEIAPRVEHIVALMPYEGEHSYYENIADFTGDALYVAGSEDETSLPPMVEDWFDRVTSARRALHVEIEGAGHQAVTDFQWGQESMDDQVQLDTVEHLATSFLRAEVLGDEALYHDIIGPGGEHIPATIRSHSQVPAVWAHLDDDGQISVGVAGLSGASLDLHLGAQVGGIDTPALTDAALTDGLWHGTVDVPAELQDGLYLQGLAHLGDESHSTRVVEVIAGEPAVAGAEDDSGDGRIGGCDATSRAPIGWLALLSLGLVYRRGNPGFESAHGSTTLSA